MNKKYFFLIFLSIFLVNKIFGQYDVQVVYTHNVHIISPNVSNPVYHSGDPEDFIINMISSSVKNLSFTYSYTIDNFKNGDFPGVYETYNYSIIPSSFGSFYLSKTGRYGIGHLSYTVKPVAPSFVHVSGAVFDDSQPFGNTEACSGDTLEIKPSGGGPYYKLYKKVNGGTQTFVTIFSGSYFDFPTTHLDFASNVEYIVYSCNSTGTVVSSSSTSSSIITIYGRRPTATINSTNLLCSQTEGSITLSNISGVSTSYKVSGTNLSTTNYLSDIENVTTSCQWTGVNSGDYEITLLNADGYCYTTFRTTVIDNYTGYELNVNPTVDVCSGSITANLSHAGHDGSKDYILQKNTGKWNEVFSSQSNDSIYNFPAQEKGEYRVLVTDTVGCTDTTSSFNIYGYPSYTTNSINSPLCHQTSLGTIEITSASDASELPFNCTFSQPITGDSIKDISASGSSIDFILGENTGNYSLVVKNSQGCSDTTEFELVNPSLLNLNIDNYIVDCGNNTGEIKVSATGGTAEINGYNFTCDTLTGKGNSFTFDSLEGLHTYNLVVEDKNKCTASASQMLDSKEITYIPTVSTFTDGYNITCEDSGQISFSSIVNADNYTFSSQSYNDFGDVVSNLSFSNIFDPGKASITFTNDSGCSAIWSQDLTKSPELNSLTINLTPASADYDIHCDKDALLSFTTNQDSSFYRTVDWKLNGSSFSDHIDINASSAGTYNVSVITKYGCSINKDIILDKSPEILGLNINIQANSDFDIYCNNPAVLTPVFSGNHVITSYNWIYNEASVGTNSTFNATNAGIYSVTLKDNYGCSANANTPEITKSKDYTNISVVKNVLPLGNYDIYCNQNGRLTVTTEGGESYNNPVYNFTVNGNTTSKTVNYLDVSEAGAYTVQVIDKYGCSISQSNIDVSKSPDFSYLNLDVNSAGADFDIYCNKNAIITPSFNSGHTISYDWTLPDGSHSSLSSLNTNAEGIYTLQITDNYGCFISNTTPFLTKSPEIYQLSISAPEITDGYEITCAQNSNIGISNISWYGTASIFEINSYLWNNSSVASNLNTDVEGSYYLSVIDEHGCSALSNTVTINKAPSFDVDLHSGIVGTGGYNITCGNNGAINLSYSGDGAANPKTNIEWKYFDNILPNNTEYLNNITSEGWYYIDITDKYGCTANDSINLTHSPSPEISLDVTKDAQNLTGDITVNITNGIPPYTIALDKIDEPVSSVSGTETVFSNLQQGMYRVTVTDVNGCSDLEMVDIYSNTLEFTLDPTISNVKCKGSSTGSFVSSISGGTAPYRYKLYKNSNLIDEQNNINTLNILNLSAGDYSLEIWDADNNPYGDINYGYIYTFSISEPANMLNAAIASNNVLIYGQNTGEINANASGGWGNYSYSMDGTNYSTNNIFSNLYSNNYSVFVKDNNGCVVSKNIEITQSDELILNYSISPVKCNGGSDGSFILSASGGVGTYQYSFNNSNFTSTTLYNHLTANDYEIVVKDGVGAYDTVFVDLTEPQVLLISSYDVEAAACQGECGYNIGSAKVNVSGGTVPYSYQWDDDCGHNTQTASTLPSGIFNVLVTDKNGCKINGQVSVPSLDAPKVDIDVVNVLCNSEKTGSVTLNVTDGNPPYNFDWGTIEDHTENSANNLNAGNYNVIVSDANNCETIANFEINQPQAINVSYQIQEPKCHGDSDGQIEAIVSGGTLPYQVSWNLDTAVVNSDLLINLSSNYYKLNIQDDNLCNFFDTIFLPEPDAIDLGLQDSYKICQNSNILLKPNGNFEQFNWTSTNGFESTLSEVNVSNEGTYFLNVINSNGCIATDSTVIIISNDLLTAKFLMVSEANVNDTIVIIEISNPKPDSLEWNIPESFLDIYNENEVKFVVPTIPGVFNVHMNAIIGGCYDAIDKSITILGEDTAKTEQKVPSPKTIESVKLYPNPNNGDFYIDIDLSEKMPVSIEVYDNQQYSKILSLESKGQDFYNFYISLGKGHPGVYVLRIKTLTDQKNIKFIINR